MITKNNIKYLLLTFLVFGYFQGKTQVNKTIEKQAKLLKEQIHVFTDRDIYSVDEYIRFSAVNHSNSALRNADWSNVLYLELVTHDGSSRVQRKYNFSADGASGVMYIPRDVESGNYYLRAYTRWMRNYPAGQYFYKLVTIVNPFDDNVLQGKEEDVTRMKGYDKGLPLSIKLNKINFAKREKASFELNAVSKLSNCVISISKKELVKAKLPQINRKAIEVGADFIPETRSLSLSGKVVRVLDSVPMPFHRINLTILKDIPEVRSAVSAEDGHFYFDLPALRGEYEVLISPGKGLKNDSVSVLIDNDFSTQSLQLPFVPFKISALEKEGLNTLVLNSQVQHLYENHAVKFHKESILSEKKFYGEPDLVVDFENFIALPKLEDYFKELIPMAAVRKSGGQKHIHVVGKMAELDNYAPLVLLDMVIINDMNELLNVLPEKIERIEVINRGYVHGGITYGGIVSIFSKERDLADIHLSSGLLFVNFLSVDDIRCGEGTDLGNNQYEQMDDQPVIHSYYEFNEADKMFADMKFVVKETRKLERIHNNKHIKQGYIDYIYRK